MDLAEKHALWRKPRHHLDAETSSDHVHWIELFYDLVHGYNEAYLYRCGGQSEPNAALSLWQENL